MSDVVMAAGSGAGVLFGDLPFSDLRFALAAAQRDVLEQVLAKAELLARISSNTEADEVAVDIQRTTGCKLETARRVMRALALPISWILSADASVGSENFIEVLRGWAASAEQTLSDDEWHSIKGIVDGLLAEREHLQSAATAGRVIRGFLPMLERFQATLELRSSELPLEEGRSEESVDGILELTPIASIQLMLDSGYPKAICFQATKEDLAKLEKQVRKLQEQMQALSNRISVREVKASL
jgi:hypothetical protein